MANSHLIASIHHACAEYKDRRISVADLQDSLEGNGSALEGLERAAYAKLHDFSNALEKIQFACLLEKQYDETCKDIAELQEYLDTLS